MEMRHEGAESEPQPKDISAEFAELSVIDFQAFLETQKAEPALSITVDWKDKQAARRLKAFLEDFHALELKQKRTATIRATRAQYMQELNVFASGVQWEEV